MKARLPIIPGDLTTTVEEFGRRLDFASKVAGAIHIDVADGRFVPTATLEVDAWPKISLGYAEAHLMVRDPIPYLEKLKKVGITRSIVHIESFFDPEQLVNHAREIDMLLGFAINPDTDLDHLRPFYEISNYIQVMGIVPGATGRAMLTQTPASVSYLRRVPNRRLIISVDGGVNIQNIQNLFRVGANYCVASSAIYDEGDWTTNFQNLSELVEATQ